MARVAHLSSPTILFISDAWESSLQWMRRMAQLSGGIEAKTESEGKTIKVVPSSRHLITAHSSMLPTRVSSMHSSDLVLIG